MLFAAAAAVLVPVISSGIDLLLKAFSAYRSLPDGDEALLKRLEELELRLIDTKAAVEAVVIKDV